MAKLLLSKLLEFNPSKRYSAYNALNHPWITRRIYDDIPNTHLEMWNIRSLKNKFREFFGAIIFVNKFSNNKIIAKKEKFARYIEIIEDISSKKRIEYLIERQKCFDVIPTETNLDSLRESFLIKKSNRNDLFTSTINFNYKLNLNSNNGIFQTESTYSNNTKSDLALIQIARARENLIKRTLKIKLIKDDSGKNSTRSENNSTKDASPNTNIKSLRSSASSLKLVGNKKFSYAQKYDSSISPILNRNLNNQFKFNYNRSNSKMSCPEFSKNNFQLTSPIKQSSNKKLSNQDENIWLRVTNKNKEIESPNTFRETMKNSNRKFHDTKSNNGSIIPKKKISEIYHLLLDNVNVNSKTINNRKKSFNELGTGRLVLPEIKSPQQQKKLISIFSTLSKNAKNV